MRNSATSRVKSVSRSTSVGVFEDLFWAVEWSVPLIAFCYYFFVVTTFFLTAADAAIIISLVTLPMQRFPLRFGRANLLFGLFVLWVWITQTVSVDVLVSFDAAWLLTKVWVIALVAYNVLRTRAQLRMFFAFSLACFMLFPVRGAFVNYFGGYDVQGRALWNFAYSNPNDLAAFGILYGTFALVLTSLSRNTLVRLMSFGSLAVIVLLILFTQSRGALLAVGGMLVALVIPRLKNPRVLVGAVALGIGAIMFAPASVWTRLGGLAKITTSETMELDKERSAEQRFQILQIAAIIASDHPLTGVGPGAYAIVHREYAAKLVSQFPIAQGAKDAHNTYLRTAAETGYVGLALFLSLVISMVAWAFKTLKKSKGSEREILRFLAYGLIAYLAAGFFGSYQYLSILYVHLVLIEAMIRDQQDRATAPAAARRPRRVFLAPTRPVMNPASTPA